MIEHYIIVPVAIATSAPVGVYTIGAIVGATSVTTAGLMKCVEYALQSYKPTKEKNE